MPISLVGDAVRDHFFRPEPFKRVEAISPRGLMREGWFNAELVYLFSEMEKRGTIKSWESECLVNKGQKINFRLRLLEETVVIEVKAAPTRYKDGKPYPLLGYADPNCVREIPKMLAVQANSYYLLIFAYPAPPANDWNVLAKKIEGRRPGYTVTVSMVDELPELSIGWLEVSKEASWVGNISATS